MSRDREIITAIQEQLDRSMLTVRHNGRVLGKVYQNGRGDWRIEPPDPPITPAFGTLGDAVDWLIEREGEANREQG